MDGKIKSIERSNSQDERGDNCLIAEELFRKRKQ